MALMYKIMETNIIKDRESGKLYDKHTIECDKGRLTIHRCDLEDFLKEYYHNLMWHKNDQIKVEYVKGKSLKIDSPAAIDECYRYKKDLRRIEIYEIVSEDWTGA